MSDLSVSLKAIGDQSAFSQAELYRMRCDFEALAKALGPDPSAVKAAKHGLVDLLRELEA